MEHDIKVTSKTLAIVKEIVDFIYEATVVEGGYKGGWSKYSTRFRKVASILVKRGVLVREGKQLHTLYKWNNAAMYPTNPFYKSVAQEMVKDERAIMARSYQKKKRQKVHDAAEAQKAAVADENETVQENVPADMVQPADEAEIAPETATSLASFSDQELWDELKRRGARIVAGRVKMVKEIELA